MKQEKGSPRKVGWQLRGRGKTKLERDERARERAIW